MKLLPLKRIKCVQRQIGFNGLHVVDCCGYSGELALLWNDTDSVSVLDSSRNFIDAKVSLEQGGVWRFTGFYGFPERSKRRESWNLMRDLASRSNLPWCIMGDFNNLLSQREKYIPTMAYTWIQRSDF